MAVQYIDNLSYKGKKPNFERDQFKTLAEMKAFLKLILMKAILLTVLKMVKDTPLNLLTQ